MNAVERLLGHCDEVVRVITEMVEDSEAPTTRDLASACERLLAAAKLKNLLADVVAESSLWGSLAERVVHLSKQVVECLDGLTGKGIRIHPCIQSATDFVVMVDTPVSTREDWSAEKTHILLPAVESLRAYAKPPATAATPEKKTDGSEQVDTISYPPASCRKRVGRPRNDEELDRELLDGWRAFEPVEGRKRKDDYLAQRPEVRALKDPKARQRKIASLRVALDSALHLRREKKKRLRG